MAHIAQIDENNIVIQVLPISDSIEDIAENLYATEFGGTWLRTSYNTYGNEHKLGKTPFRYNFAGLGYVFMDNIGENGAFVAPKPFPSWTLNTNTCLWEPPIPYPGLDGDSGYIWNEELLMWIK